MQDSISDSTPILDQFRQKLICPLSLDLLQNPYCLPCHHKFSCAAIMNHLQTSSSCPVCQQPANVSDLRRDITTEQFLNFYLSQVKSQQNVEKALKEVKDQKSKEQTINPNEQQAIRKLNSMSLSGKCMARSDLFYIVAQEKTHNVLIGPCGKTVSITAMYRMEDQILKEQFSHFSHSWVENYKALKPQVNIFILEMTGKNPKITVP